MRYASKKDFIKDIETEHRVLSELYILRLKLSPVVTWSCDARMWIFPMNRMCLCTIRNNPLYRTR